MKRASRLSAVVAALALIAPAIGLLMVAPRSALAAPPSYDPDSCANGAVGSTATTCTNGWINGNLIEQKAHYAEAESVAYRAKLSGLTPGPWTLTLGWDVLQNGKHAIDYLTTYNRTVTGANPCTGVSSCNPAVSTTKAIPKDTVTPAPANQVPGVFTMFGAVIDSVSGYTNNGDETTITVSFTVAAITDPVLAWGGHIASRADWGAGNSAAAIAGSPFHMRVKGLNGQGGNKDMQLAAAAVIFPASITVVKVAAPKGGEAFTFSAPALAPGTFTLVDDGDPTAPFDRKTFSGITDFGTDKTITESPQAGWTLTGINCVGLATAPTISGAAVTVRPAEAEDVTCTFSNVKSPSITATKTADPTSIDEPGGSVKFAVTVHNDSPVENVTLTALSDAPYGNVAVAGGKVLDTTCSVPQTIAANATYLCSFHAAVTGDAKTTATDVVTATAKDLRDNVLTDDDDASVTIVDVKPLLQVDKSVSPSVVAEPGGSVNFTVAVTNPSVEAVTLNSLNDDKFGSLAGKGTCSVPQTIAPKATYTCAFPATVNGDPRTPHVDTVTGTATDNEGNQVVDTGMATVTFTDVLPKVVVDKSASPSELPEPGGKVTFKVVVTNPQGAVEHIDLTALQDAPFGNLNGQGTCDVSKPVDLAPGASYTCTFDKQLTGDAPDVQTDTVTATVRDDDGNTVTGKDDASVKFLDVLPNIEVEKTASPTTVPEPGGNVTFAVRVVNPVGAAEPVEIVSLVDDIYGDLANKGSCLLSAPLILAPGGTYSCSFSAYVAGQPRQTKTDTITGKAKDDEGNVAQDTATATVTVTDVLPSVAVDKAPDPASVPETGGLVTFTVRVKNPASAVESIFLSELTDDVFGDLNGKGNCDVTPPITLAVGGEYVCMFTATIAGNAGQVHTDTVTAAVSDDEKNRVTGSHQATVPFTDVKPTILVDKAALPDTLPEPGGNVTYSVAVTNTSLEAVTLTGLVDDPGIGPLAGKGDCLAGGPVSLLAGQTYHCTFSAPVNGDANSVHTDTVTATATDDERNEVTGRDSATVTITDVKPAILVDKGAAPSEIAEPGGTVTFTVVVTNPPTAVEPVTLSSLDDSVYGNLDGKGSCNLATAGPIAVGGHYTCSFPGPVAGNAGSTHDDVVTAVAKDNEGNLSPPATDTATVTVLNVAPKIVVDKLPSPSQVSEPGGTVNFTVTVTNPGTAEALTLSSLHDDVYGDLNGKGNCTVPQTIAENGGQYTCAFPGDVSGDAGSTHADTVTAAARDDDGNTVNDSARAVVTVVDVKPTVLVGKSAAPSTLPEPGGTGTFTVTVTNPASAVEAIKVTSLIDNVYGSLNGKGTCSVTPAVELAPGARYTCSFTGPVEGNAGTVHADEVTGTANDNEGNKATATDTAQITISDVLPAIKVDKTAGTSTVHAGDSVTYTYAVHNVGVEPLRDVAVSDDRCSPLTRTGGDTNGDTLLDLTETWTYTCTASLTGTTTNTATGTGRDDEGNTAVDKATATVTVVNPKIVIDKVANLTRVGVGDTVTYTYTVTNPGNAPLADVAVTDDKCGPVTFTSGDTDNDSLLDPAETWKFGCTATLSNPGQITNTGTVNAKDPIGGPVSATDTAVVTVLDAAVLPAVEAKPGVLRPAPNPTQAEPARLLPITGGDILRLAAFGLALVTGGLLLRRRRPQS